MFIVAAPVRAMLSRWRRRSPPRSSRSSLIFLGFLCAALLASCGKRPAGAAGDGNELAMSEFAPGIAFTNHRISEVPWSVQVVRVDRSRPDLELHSTHARGRVMGMSTLSEQIRAAARSMGRPLAGVNGDFYQRDRAYAGDPRGLQIVQGDLISGPIGGVAFWVDAAGQPHATNVTPQFTVTWPGGQSTPFGLNEGRSSRGVVLYTPTLGPSTKTSGGRELVLERTGDGAWLPLRAGESYQARVREVRETGDTPLQPDALVLSIGPSIARSLPEVAAGAVLKISTGTTPDLKGARTAISGGPMLAHVGKRTPLPKPNGSSSGYAFSSMTERHPRSAIGWNDRYFFLIQVDGRQRDLSIGMTLEELGDYMVSRLGCTEAMNLDGGGSATFWCNGRVTNSPCDGHERDIANALIVVRTEKSSSSQTPLSGPANAGQVPGGQ